VTDHYIIKLEPETLDPNYFTDNPGEDPNDYVQILYTRINDTLPEQAEPFFITSSIEVGTRILFAVNRNPHATALFNGLSLVDITVTDDYNCEVQNEFRDADINHDCYVNLADLALLAGDWLQCNDPEGPGCTPEDVNAVVRVDFNGYYEYNLPHSNAAWTYEGPGLLGTGTYWNGAEVYWKTPNTILSVYHPGSGTSDDRFLLNDGVTDSHVTVTLAGNQYGDNLAGGEPNPVGNDLLTDYLLSYMEDPNIVITIGGLIPGNAYRLAGYGSHGGAGLGGVWTANGVGPMDLSQSVADTGILENVIADAQGNIIVEIDKDSQYTAATVTVVNGLELEGVFNATFTCQAQGIYKDADIDQNCYVNLEDFAEIANVWLQCNDPKDGNCMPIE